MSNAHLIMLGLVERAYRVSLFQSRDDPNRSDATVVQFAPYAEEHDDLDNYLGYAEIALFQVYKHHDAEGRMVAAWSSKG